MRWLLIIQSNIAILIPALNPDHKLFQLVQELRREGFDQFVVVDDGSEAECMDIFRQLGKTDCLVVRHEQNHGKGAAIKTALRIAAARFHDLNGCITVDADGQHLPKDVRNIAESMRAHPNSLVLGVRDFGSRCVPMRSLLGNRITSAFFHLVNGVCYPDTQTGLRGFLRRF